VKVLVACEEGQEVCKAFRAKDHQAYSCDILPCSGGHPEWHIKNKIENVLLNDHHLLENGDLLKKKLRKEQYQRAKEWKRKNGMG
jgi:hypothetical protein